MNENQLVGFTEISKTLGSGNLVTDVVLLSLGLSLVALVFGLIVYRRSLIPQETPGLERLSGIVGRIEKLEMTLNEFRTEVLRNIEISRADMGYLKIELEYLRRLLEQNGPAGGGEPPEDGGAPPSDDEDGGFNPPDSDTHGALGAQPSAIDLPALPAAPQFVEHEAEVEEPEPESRGLFARLSKTRSGFLSKIKGLFGLKNSIDAASLDQLEEILISSDIGVKTTQDLISAMQREVESGGALSEEGLLEKLQSHIRTILLKDAPADPRIYPVKREDGPLVLIVVGVNGAGKTTTVAKLAHQWTSDGARVMVAAADTFRAAAVDQLLEWGRRLNVPVISGAADAKPATVVFEAMTQAKNNGVDVLIIDTAGRLHTKSNLMQELEGIRNVIQRHQPSAPHEVLLVVDGSSGQNALQQAREFNAAVTLSGLVVTKLDGTPKGGIVVAIKSELGVPIRYIGVGEKREDLQAFDPAAFAEALCRTGEGDVSDPASAYRSTDSVIH